MKDQNGRIMAPFEGIVDVLRSVFDRRIFEPAVTQEAAAERLPFSTYRYHLARGEDRVVEWLWNLELTG